MIYNRGARKNKKLTNYLIKNTYLRKNHLLASEVTLQDFCLTVLSMLPYTSLSLLPLIYVFLFHSRSPNTICSAAQIATGITISSNLCWSVHIAAMCSIYSLQTSISHFVDLFLAHIQRYNSTFICPFSAVN